MLTRVRSAPSTLLSRAGTAGMLTLVVLDLVRVLELAGPWLAVAGAFALLWLAPPLVVAARIRRRRHRGTSASWLALEERLAAEREADERARAA